VHSNVITLSPAGRWFWFSIVAHSHEAASWQPYMSNTGWRIGCDLIASIHSLVVRVVTVTQI
jgi:hypothetical protein